MQRPASLPTAAIALAIAVVAACRREPPEPTIPPVQPPGTLETIAREPIGFPPATEPLRRDDCDVPLAVSPEGLMRPDAISELQERLVDAKLLRDGSFERGILDAPTLDAILSLQRREGLPRVGVPTYATVRALGLAPERVFHAGDAECDGGGT